LGEATSAIETEDAARAARIEVANHNVADLDRRLAQVDTAIEEAARRVRTSTALSAIEGQRKARLALPGEQKREGSTLADLKAERAKLVVQGKQIEMSPPPNDAEADAGAGAGAKAGRNSRCGPSAEYPTTGR
jgi:small-conductance mechanosensitive channel